MTLSELTAGQQVTWISRQRVRKGEWVTQRVHATVLKVGRIYAIVEARDSNGSRIVRHVKPGDLEMRG